MDHNKRPKRSIWRIFFGLFTFLLLAFLLYASQFIVTCYLSCENSLTELNQIKDELSSYLQQEELDQTAEDYYRRDTQKAALLLSSQELSNEKLATVMENLMFSSGIALFQQDGAVLYTYGDITDDPDFLNRLISSGNEKAENGSPYRAIPFENDLYLAVSFPYDLAEVGTEKEQYDLEVVKILSSGMSNDIIVANKKTNRVLYGPNDIIKKNLADFLIIPYEEAATMNFMMVGNKLTAATIAEHEDYLLLSIIDFSYLFHSLHETIMPALLGFGFIIFFLLSYAQFIRIDMGMGRLGNIHYIQIGKRRYLNTMLLRKLSGFAVISISCMICITYCLQLLIRSDEQKEHAETRLSIAIRLLEENQTYMAENAQTDKKTLIETAKEIRSMLSLNPILLSEEGLNSISRLFFADHIYVLDDSGKVEFSNHADLQHTFMLSSNATDTTYSFWDVVNGFAEGHVQFVQNDPLNQNKDMLYVGVAGAENQGLILYTFPYEYYANWQHEYDGNTALKSVGIGSQSLLLATRAGSTACVFDSSNQYTGLSLDAYGLNETFLRNGYSGTHTFDGRNCLITTRTVQDWNLIYITPTDWISTSSWFFTVLVIITGLVVAIFSVLPWLFVRTPGEDLRRPARKDHSTSHRSHVDAIVTRDGVELVENRVEHHTMKKRWRIMDASAKLNHLIRILMLLIGCSMLFFILFGINAENYPLIDMLLEQNWDKSLNVYALTYVVIVLISIWFVASLLQTITRFVTGTFSRRWKTLGILISNIIRYTALIASIFFTLQTFGVETSALITSASVLTLVFGLGCQSFVADMVAGVFLIFEGTFRVGDIVTVDGWRGEVVEIGLRTTNVKNELGNIKVFQNSRISGAINMTRDLTCAVCDIILPPGEPLKAYEEKLTTEFFPIAKENIRSIRLPLEYEGVVAVNGDSATLRISVKCREIDREQIRRDLFRELKLWREQK